MARASAPPSDLEIENPDGRSPGSGPGHRPTLSRTHLILITAVVVAALAVAFPLRVQLNRSEAGRLQRRWMAMDSLDQARSADLTALSLAAAPGDGIQVHSTAAQLYEQQAADLDSLRKNLHDDVIIDSRLRRLRAAMTHALVLEGADLRNAGERWTAAPPGSAPSDPDRQPSTTAAIDKADQLLVSQIRRFSLPTLRPTPTPHFPPAEATIASFRRFLDHSTGVTLLADTSSGLQTIDVDRSVIHPAQVAGLPAGVENLVVVRPDWLVFQHPDVDGRQSSFYVVPSRRPSSAVPIGTGGQVVAGSDPSTFWLISADDTAVEVDAGGAVLAGPVPLPPNRFVVAATATGLVLQPHLQSDQSLVAQPIEIWDALARRPVRTITDSGLGVLAGDAKTVAWVSGSNAIHLTDTVSGSDRIVATPGYTEELVGAALSPDGTRLAITMRSPEGSHTMPAVIDLSSGVVHIGASNEFPPEQPGPVAWTANGDRLFVPMSSASPTDQLLTYQPGAGGPNYLRLPRTEHLNVYAVAPIDAG